MQQVPFQDSALYCDRSPARVELAARKARVRDAAGRGDATRAFTALLHSTGVAARCCTFASPADAPDDEATGALPDSARIVAAAGVAAQGATAPRSRVFPDFASCGKEGCKACANLAHTAYECNHRELAGDSGWAPSVVTVDDLLNAAPSIDQFRDLLILQPARHAAPNERGLRVPLVYKFASADAPFDAKQWAVRAGEGAQASYELVGLLDHAWPRRPCVDVHVDGARGTLSRRNLVGR